MGGFFSFGKNSYFFKDFVGASNRVECIIIIRNTNDSIIYKRVGRRFYKKCYKYSESVIDGNVVCITGNFKWTFYLFTMLLRTEYYRKFKITTLEKNDISSYPIF